MPCGQLMDGEEGSIEMFPGRRCACETRSWPKFGSSRVGYHRAFEGNQHLLRRVAVHGCDYCAGSGLDVGNGVEFEFASSATGNENTVDSCQIAIAQTMAAGNELKSPLCSVRRVPDIIALH